MRGCVPGPCTRLRRPATVANGGGFTTRRGLIAVASAVPMAESAVVGAVAPAARVLAPQGSALAPLAVFHDLRWLFGSGGTWLGFAAALIAVVAARSALDATLAWLAWPRGQIRPRLTFFLGSGAVLTLCAGLLMSPLVTLAFGVALLPFSWPFLAALPLLVLLALLLSHGGVARWWRMLPPPRAAGWLIADFVALSMAAVIISRLPGAWAVPIAGVGGVINARAWYGVTASVAAPRPARRLQQPAWRIPVAPVAAVLAFALVIGVTRLGFVVAAGSHPGVAGAAAALPVPGTGQVRQESRAPGTERGPVVLEIQGFGSSCCTGTPALQAITSGGIAQQFSYRGLDARGRPLPYRPAASNLPLPVLGDRIAAQVQRLHRDTGRPVDLVAESEGTLGVYAMLARHPHAPVGSIVLLSPIVAPGQVSYPAGNQGGRGAVPGYALRAVVWFIGGLSSIGTSGAEQLINSVDSSGALYANDAARATRHHPLRWIAVVPLADSLTLPACSSLPAAAVVVPGLHGGLLGTPAVQQIVRSFLTGRSIPDRPSLRDAAEIVAQAAAAWRMPELVTPSPPCPQPGASAAGTPGLLLASLSRPGR
jgi:hypothetical protein